MSSNLESLARGRTKIVEVDGARFRIGKVSAACIERVRAISESKAEGYMFDLAVTVVADTLREEDGSRTFAVLDDDAAAQIKMTDFETLQALTSEAFEFSGLSEAPPEKKTRARAAKQPSRSR